MRYLNLQQRITQLYDKFENKSLISVVSAKESRVSGSLFINLQCNKILLLKGVKPEFFKPS
jgi:hypothetical protein